MPERKPLILVDGSGYLYRAFHALPPLTSSRGEPTGAIYGVANMLRRLLKDYDPELVAVVFDAPGRTFRDELFERYKANRPPMPEELVAQLEPLRELVDAMGLPRLEVPGVEADDVIGTLARRGAAQGLPVIVSTGDKDMAQLVDGGIVLVDTMRNRTLDRSTVEERFGVPPERIVDWLALVGDSSDNIPGVPRVGPKTAAKWLRQYGSLDGIVRHADEIPGKAGESLRAHLDQLALSRELARIRTDLDLDVDPASLRRRPPDLERLRALLQRLEFTSWLRELPRAGAPEAAPTRAAAAGGAQKRAGGPPAEGGAPEAAPRYELVLDEAALGRWLERLRAAPLFAFDTETTSLDYMEAQVVGVSFAVAPGEAAYVPLAHDYEGAPAQLDREAVLERLRPLLEDPDRPKLGHNLKYDMSVLANHGIALAGLAYDTMLESYVLNSTASRHDLDSLALKYLGHRNIAYHEVAGKGTGQVDFNQVRLDQAGPYAAEDADIALRLHERLWPELAAQPGPRRVFEEIEMPLVPVLSRMERTGVLVDVASLREQSRLLARRMREIEAEAHRLAGEPFNLASPKQIQEILYGRLGLPVLARTPRGQPSTAESVLAELATQYELPRLILDYRQLAKLKSTYADRLPEQVDPRTGRVHTSYHQAVAATGRLSSSDPNLQNIPVRTEEGRRIRRAFVAPAGWKLLAADYSQIELRIMAHLSGDEGLLAAFAEGRDIHAATAAEVFGTALEAVSAEQRRAAKAINFGLIYGMSAFGLARQLGIEREAAQSYVDLYFARYPKVKAFMDAMREKARREGYVETLFGRRLYVPEIRSRNAQRRQYAERTAINAPMQGSAADIIKRAMIRLDAWIRASDVPVRMIMQVHDELVFEVEAGFVEEARARIRTFMEGAAELRVPLVVETGVGDNWDEAH